MSDDANPNPFLATNPKNPKFKHPCFEAFDVTDRYAQVCSKYTTKATLKRLKEAVPGEWKLAKRYHGGPNPSICDDMPNSHMQFLFETV